MAPTAHADVDDAAHTPASEPVTLCADHAVPFECATTLLPTAQTSPAAVPWTDRKSAVVPDTTADHVVPFQRTIPDFEPSAESYAIAIEVVERGRAQFAAIGVTDPAHFDLWTALVSGLGSQQAANDPGGDRWLRLIDDAVEMFANHVLPKRPRSKR